MEQQSRLIQDMARDKIRPHGNMLVERQGGPRDQGAIVNSKQFKKFEPPTFQETVDLVITEVWLK